MTAERRRRGGGRRRPVAVLAAALAALAAVAAGGAPGAEAPPPAAAGDLSAAAERGRVLYRTGASPSGDEAVAVLAGGAVEVPAAALPCASCHGEDGRGRAEGGVSPSDLTWPSLTRPYEVTTRGGRRHGPYDEAKLVRAVTMGIDPAGNELDPVMPRYRLSRRDADDLVTYLRRLGRDRDPGVGERAVELGVLLPPEGAGDEAAGAVRAVLDAHAAGVNAAGGVYQRRIELVYRRLPAAPEERAAAAEAFLAEDEPFALVAPSFFGVEEELAAVAAERRVPTVGPLTLEPPHAALPERWVFYLDPGLTGLARALVRHAAAEAPSGRPLALVREERGPAAEAVAAAAREEAARLGLAIEEVALGGDPAAAVAALAAGGADRVVLLAAGAAGGSFLAAAAAAGWAPEVLLVGPLAGPALFERADGFAGRLRFAFPSLPSDRTAAGLAVARQALGGAVPEGATGTAAYVAMDLVVEALRRAGRDLTRNRLVDALEGLRGHLTGLVPPLTFGPNRRIGTGGAWLVEWSPGGGPAGEPVWVDLAG